MKIVVNARFLTQPLSGVQRYGIECSRQIKKLYPEAEFVAPAGILHVNIAKELNVKIIGRNKGQLWEHIDLPMYLARKGSPPLLNLANTAPALYGNSYVTIHDMAFYHHPEWNSRKFATWYNVLIPRIAISAKHVFTVSNTVRGELLQHYKLPPAKVSVAFNGLSAAMLAAGPYGGTKEKVIFAVGTFNIRKNHQRLIEGYIASALKDTHKLVIMGDRNRVFAEARLDEDIIRQHNVQLYETMSEDELLAMYRRAEIVASTSLYEGFGIPLLEGLYNGCKAACSDIPVYRELYEGYAAFCDPGEPLSVAGALEGAAARGIAGDPVALSRKFSYERSAAEMIARIAAK